MHVCHKFLSHEAAIYACLLSHAAVVHYTCTYNMRASYPICLCVLILGHLGVQETWLTIKPTAPILKAGVP